MDSDPTFAQPLAKLGESGIGVAAAPTPGQGLALSPSGRVPFSTLPEPWRYFADESRYRNSWADAGTGILRVRFRKVAGIVFVEGQATKAIKPAAELIAALPDGYWPQNSIPFLVPDPGAAFGQGTEISVSAAGITFEGSAAPGGGPVFPHLVISFSPYIP